MTNKTFFERIKEAWKMEKREWNKITWLPRKKVERRTLVILSAAAVTTIMIASVDSFIQFCLRMLASLM